jgi:hypothetical protein
MVSFIGGGNRSIRRKPLTWRKSLTMYIEMKLRFFHTSFGTFAKYKAFPFILAFLPTPTQHCILLDQRQFLTPVLGHLVLCPGQVCHHCVFIIHKLPISIKLWFWLWCLMPLSTIFQLYRDGQFYWWRKPEYPGKNHRLVASHWQIVSHNVVSSTPCYQRDSNTQRSGDTHWIYM